MQQQETIHAVMAPLDDDFIRSRIYTFRGVQVMLDGDLATMYGVDAKRINEQVKRNAERFPEDFMFRLTKDECLRSPIATLNIERGKHLKYMPHAFTESGVAMLSGALRSTVAIDVNVRRSELDTSWHGVQVGTLEDYNPKGYCNFDKAGHDQASRFNQGWPLGGREMSRNGGTRRPAEPQGKEKT